MGKSRVVRGALKRKTPSEFALLNWVHVVGHSLDLCNAPTSSFIQNLKLIRVFTLRDNMSLDIFLL